MGCTGSKSSMGCICLTPSNNNHGRDDNFKQENRDHSTSPSSSLGLKCRENISMTNLTDSDGDETSDTVSLSDSTSSQPPSDWQSEKPSDWQWKQGSMTSIPSTIKTSASARSTPILWKVSKRHKSSKIIKEI